MVNRSQETPRRKDDPRKKCPRMIDYKASASDSSPLLAARFIFECGFKLRAAPETIALACIFFHRFYREHPEDYDKFLLGSAAVYLAGRVKYEKYLIRDVVNVAHRTIYRDSDCLELKNEYWARRDAVIQTEQLMLRFFKFSTVVSMPHCHLVHYLMTLKNWISGDVWSTTPIAQASLAFLQDLHHDPVILSFEDVRLVALGCISLSLLVYGVRVPGVKEDEESGRLWFNHLCPSANAGKVWEVMNAIMNVYVKLADV